jgi:hypothetical protein
VQDLPALRGSVGLRQEVEAERIRSLHFGVFDFAVACCGRLTPLFEDLGVARRIEVVDEIVGPCRADGLADENALVVVLVTCGHRRFIRLGDGQGLQPAALVVSSASVSVWVQWSPGP